MLRYTVFVLFGLLVSTLFANERLDRVLDVYLPLSDREAVDVQPLVGGLDSQVYLAVLPRSQFVVRFLDETAPLSDILKELWITTTAAEKGLGPQVLHIDLAHRALVLEYIASNGSLDFTLLAKTLKSLHCKQPFEPFATLRQKREALFAAAFPLPEEATVLWESLLAMQNGSYANHWAVCHNDLHSLNVLFDGHQLRIIDWTSSGVGIPEFDVVKLTAGWAEEDKEAFYEAYYGHAPTSEDRLQIGNMQQMHLGLIFFNRWLHLKNSVSQNNYDEIARRLVDWQIRPLRHYLDCPVDGSSQDLFEGALSALQEFLRVFKNQNSDMLLMRN